MLEENKGRSPTRSLHRSSPQRNYSPTHSSHRSSSPQPHEDHFVTRSSLSLSPQRIPDLEISSAEKLKTLTKGMFRMEDSATRIVHTKLKWQTILGHVVVSEEEQQNEEIKVGLSKESEKKPPLISRLLRRRLMSRLLHLKSNKIAALYIFCKKI